MRPACRFYRKIAIARARFASATAMVILMTATPFVNAEESKSTTSSPIALRWNVGFDFSQGDYGLRNADQESENTTLYFVPIGVTVDYQRLRAKLVIPFLASNGPTESDLTGQAGRSKTKMGLGQIQASGSFLFDPPSTGLPFIEAAVKVTAPTESDRSLGTGLWAFAIQLDLFQKYGRFTPFVSGGRKFYTGSSLTDRFYTSIGTSIGVSDAVSVGLSYDWLEATTAAAEDAHEIVPFAAFRVNRRLTVGPYGVVGLSDGSPNYGVGISLSVKQ